MWHAHPHVHARVHAHEHLHALRVLQVASVGGVRHFQLHARKAVLGGLSPAQNRQVSR